MRTTRPIRVSLAILVLGSLVWLMVGCVYLPWGERVHLDHTRIDFRGRDGRAASGVLAKGVTTRRQVVGMLGDPAVESANGRVVVYTLHVQHGVWVEPLCFHVTPGGQHLYALGFRFDERGVLVGQQFVVADIAPDIGIFLGPPPIWSATVDALRQIDRAGGIAPADLLMHQPRPATAAAGADASSVSRNAPPIDWGR